MAGLSETSVDPVAAAHARLLDDHSYQFSFSDLPARAPSRGGLAQLFEAAARMLQQAGPALTIVLWGVLLVVVGLILFVIVRELVIAPGERRARPAALTAEEAWRPSRARAQALLEEADRLAARGLFAEAAHVLLFRSIEDVAGRRPDLIAPSLTSRDIAALSELPPGPRLAFAEIAAVVERAVFGGRRVDAAGWSACREAYARFAFAGAWTAAA